LFSESQKHDLNDLASLHHLCFTRTDTCYSQSVPCEL
jgi:hypothetical protein